MQWRHKSMRSCTLDVGSGRGVVVLDDDGLVIEANEYARDALAKWADVIDFEVVPEESAPSKTRRKRSSTK